MSFKDKVKAIIDKRIETYHNEPDIFKSIYSQEKDLTKDYNGRQLLEMLQNCDDAEADEVLINWDKTKRILSISNTGNKFTIEGIKSLMLPGSSPKKDKIFIGNKGLGFRSILNWADVIKIFTNDCEVTFSEEIARITFNETIKITENEKERILSELGLKETAIPFPILGIPNIKENKINEWTTTIQISYNKDYDNNIQEQLDSIQEEILLFLNNIKKVKIVIDGDKYKKVYCKKYKQEKDKDFYNVEIGDKKWRVFSLGDRLLPEEYQIEENIEKEYYSLKIAINENLDNDYKRLFNFFPTKQTVDLPCLVHGTFDINNSRDYFNKSDKNDYIVKQLPDLFKICISTLKSEGINWNAYNLITPINEQTDSDEIMSFYEELNELRNELEIYPTISGEYKCIDDIKYYDNEFNSFAKEHLPFVFSDLVLPSDNNKFTIVKEYSPDEFSILLDKISSDDLSIKNRAKLISILSKYKKIKKSSLLIDKKGKKISKHEASYTPKKNSNIDYSVPDYAKINFMNIELYDELISLFKDTLKTKERDRDLKRAIDNVVNIQPYDSSAIIEQIIRRTKIEIDLLDDNNEKVVIIKEMVQSLFINYKNSNDLQRKSDILPHDILLININREIVLSEQLFLSKSYLNGNITELIYGDSMIDKYLIDVSYWNIDNSDRFLINSFFKWLGVNEYSKITTIDLYKNWSEWGYIKLSNKIGNLVIPTDYTAERLNTKIINKIEYLEIIKTLPITNIILLCLIDNKIKLELELRNISINWFYGSPKNSTYTNCSYIRYQFVDSNVFSHFLIDDSNKELNTIINNDLKIDFKLLKENGFEENEVRAILLKLGAKETFSSLSSEFLYNLLKKIPKYYEDKKLKGIQSIYKIIVDTLDKNKDECKIPKELELYANINGKLKLEKASQIYYSNNSILPKKILNTIPMLNFPKRGGEEKVKKYLGVNIINTSNVEIESKKFHDEFDGNFNSFFEALKPFILTVRLYSSNLKKEINNIDAVKQNAILIKKCNIRIVTECNYKYNGKKYNLEPYDFIIEDNTYYLRPSNTHNFNTLLKDSSFSDSFAEIMSIHFDVTELKNDFRYLIRNELNDTKHLIKQDYDNDKLDVVYKYLGIELNEIIFWKNIFKIDFPNNINKQSELKKIIFEKLNIELPNYYNKVNFNICNNQETYNFLIFISKGNNIKYIFPQGIFEWHNEKLQNIREDFEYQFKLKLWNILNKEPNKQGSYLSLIDSYNFTKGYKIFNENDNYLLELDYKSILIDWVYKTFNIELNDSNSISFNARNKYLQLLRKYNCDENDITDDNIKSLLFFEGNENDIINYLDIECQIEDANIFNETDIEIEDQYNEDDEIDAELIDADLCSDNASVLYRSNNEQTSSRGAYSKKEGEQRVIKGKEAERLVYKKLIKKYKKNNVKWVSAFSDTEDKNDKLHYDIKYRDNDMVWKYVEVKHLSNNSFIMSEPEKRFGIKENNKYEFALVDGKKIYRIYSPFSFIGDKSFDNNDFFIATPKDYIITFKINKK